MKETNQKDFDPEYRLSTPASSPPVMRRPAFSRVHDSAPSM
jgi:hypothetical protein